MTGDRRYNRRFAALLNGFGFASAALVLLSAGFGSGEAWAQGQNRFERPNFRVQQPAPEPVEVKREAPAPRLIDPNSAFGNALATCDKEQEEDNFGLPGLKGEVRLDRCYRGRKQLVCRNNAILAESKLLTDEFTRIVEQRYPDVTNLEAICKIAFDVLVKDAAGSSEFGKRFAATRSEYDARNGCATKVKQSIQDVTLPDLIQAPEVLKSMIEAVDQEINRVSVVQEQVAGLAVKIEASQKAISVLQKIHKAMCMKPNPNAEAAQAPAMN